MVAMFHGVVASDDAYNRIRARFGDTTEAGAQVLALRSLGLKATFHQNLSRQSVRHEIASGRPVILNYLHRGAMPGPFSGGHVLVAIGADSETLWVNDPQGEPDLIRGGHVPGRSGRSVGLTWRNFSRRWEVEGPGSGWGVTVRR
jgi:hypothetical protein